MDDAELLRHSAHIFLPEMGIEGVLRLTRARVLIVGLGGLGSGVALYLARAGVGALALADPDTVGLSNLPRQILYGDRHVGLPKTDAAHETLTALGATGLRLIPERLQGAVLAAEVAQADLVCDASDNFATRFAVNEACIRAAIPLVSAAVIRMTGQLLVVHPKEPAAGCYRCLYPEGGDDAESCSERGVLGPVAGAIAALQAAEAIKVLAGIPTPLTQDLWVFDDKTLEGRRIRRRRDPDCPLCKTLP
ncbi:HesA/MoeB/ThiF family protein [Acidiferrobacter sp.]|uniref:HesA/MoeB/ThiF family protein n=1 Tax=Acidiferrobacter sp. TaxID=1872107 RepID=UPI00262E5CA1|nr:HesA/MoeB/ThiF family protein [Acidiferrobacter sp.]